MIVIGWCIGNGCCLSNVTPNPIAPPITMVGSRPLRSGAWLSMEFENWKKVWCQMTSIAPWCIRSMQKNELSIFWDAKKILRLACTELERRIWNVWARFPRGMAFLPCFEAASRFCWDICFTSSIAGTAEDACFHATAENFHPKRFRRSSSPAREGWMETSSCLHVLTVILRVNDHKQHSGSNGKTRLWPLFYPVRWCCHATPGAHKPKGE